MRFAVGNARELRSALFFAPPRVMIEHGTFGFANKALPYREIRAMFNTMSAAQSQKTASPEILPQVNAEKH